MDALVPLSERPFDLTDDQHAVADMARSFGAERIAPHALDWDRTKHFPIEVMREAAALGMAAITVPEEHGGSGLGRLEQALIFEALAEACPTTAAFLSIHNMVTYIIAVEGDEAQREAWLPSLVSMDAVAAYCLTEPGSGSDAAAMRTRAVRDGGDYDVARAGWIGDYNDPQNFLFLYESDNDGFNYSRYKSEEYDALLDQAAAETDLNARAEILKQAERMLLDEVGVVPLFYYTSQSLVSPKLKGWEDNIQNVHPSRFMSIEE